MACRECFLKLSAVAIAAAVLTQVFSSAGAAPILWSSPTTISGTGAGAGSQVLTTGSLVLAYNFGGSGTSINGVPFTGWGPLGSGLTSASNTNISITTNGTATFSTNSTNQTTGSPSALYVTNPYSTLFTNQFVVDGGPNSDANSVAKSRMNFTISGLTVGQQYVLQFWANNSNVNSATGNNRVDGRTVTIADNLTFSGSQVLDVNNTDASNGGVGQFVTGTFTADATSQTFYTLGSQPSNPTTLTRSTNVASAIQVRAVPEPSTLALASLGIVSVGTWFGRRRMRLAAEKSSAADVDTTA